MQIRRYFLVATIVLLLSFGEQGLTMEDLPMEDGTSSHHSMPRLPTEMHENILSFLDDQKDLLRAGSLSKTWRKAVDFIWKRKYLDLSNRNLIKADYVALTNGPFYRLILKSVNLGEEEASALAFSSKFTHLDLSNNKIGNKEVEILASGKLFALRYLNLTKNSNIGDEGAKSIASGIKAGNLSSLEHLKLLLYDIGPNGKKVLDEAITNMEWVGRRRIKSLEEMM